MAFDSSSWPEEACRLTPVSDSSLRRSIRLTKASTDFAPEHVARDYRKYLAGQAGNTLQRLQSKVMLRKMAAAMDSVKEIGNPLNEVEASLRDCVQALPGTLSG